MKRRQFFLACFLAALVTAILGSIISTQRVIMASIPLNSAYAEQMTFGTRLSTIFQDLIGFGPVLFVLVFLAFLIAMRVAIALSAHFPAMRFMIFLGAGFVAMLAMLRALKFATFNIDIIAGTRDLTGYILFGLAGIIGGYVFYRIYRRAIVKTVQV